MQNRHEIIYILNSAREAAMRHFSGGGVSPKWSKTIYEMGELANWAKRCIKNLEDMSSLYVQTMCLLERISSAMSDDSADQFAKDIQSIQQSHTKLGTFIMKCLENNTDTTEKLDELSL